MAGWPWHWAHYTRPQVRECANGYQPHPSLGMVVDQRNGSVGLGRDAWVDYEAIGKPYATAMALLVLDLAARQ